jgi:hypothetical protein
MPSTLTNTKIAIPAVADAGPGYASTLISALQAIDALTPVGALAVASAESPSASLNVRVAAGTFANQAGTAYVTYAGTASQAIPASSTRKLWLTNAGVLTLGAAYPSTAHVRLAQVVTGGTTVTSVTDERVVNQAIGTP